MADALRFEALPRLQKWFLSAFLVTVTAGYLTGIYFVLYTTDGTPRGMSFQFRGNESVPLEQVDEIKYPKSDAEMLNIIHAHVTSFALIFFAVGGLFLFSTVRPALKLSLAVEPFAATFVLFGGMAGIRYLPEGWAPALGVLMLLAGLSTFAAVLAMSARMLWEMWR